MINQKKKNIAEKSNNKFSLYMIYSFVIHLLLFMVIVLVIKFTRNENHPKGKAVYVTLLRGVVSESTPAKSVKKTKLENLKNKIDPDDYKIPTANKPVIENENITKTITAGFDSTNLNQIYSETTLEVSIRYPVGWVYLDQQNKNKLDGVTFWLADSDINPPPYVHLEVVEKYMFNPDNYKYELKFKNFTGFYNDPTELEGQVSQSIYLLTDNKEDYIIKVIINGRKEFSKFQPVFFSMVNSFKFKSSFF